MRITIRNIGIGLAFISAMFILYFIVASWSSGFSFTKKDYWIMFLDLFCGVVIGIGAILVVEDLDKPIPPSLKSEGILGGSL